MAKTKTYVRLFDSVEEMTAAADAAYAAGRQHGVESSRFIGREIADWQDAKVKANELWTEGVETIRRLADEAGAEVTVKPISRKRRAAWSEDSGDEFDVDRMRAGQAPWLECRRQPATAPQQVTIVVNIGAQAHVESESIIWRGAAALVVADLLEAAGFSVEIYAASQGHQRFRNKNDSFLAYRIKRTDQPMDLATLVNAISGWFFRTIVFQSWYVEKTLPMDGLGQSLPLQPAVVTAELGLAAEPVIIDKVWNQTAAVALVRQVVASFAC